MTDELKDADELKEGEVLADSLGWWNCGEPK